jgi:cell division protein FtsQ
MKQIKLSIGIKIFICLLVMIGLLSFSERKMNSQAAYGNIEVIINNNSDNHYLDESDIINDVNQVFEDEGFDVEFKKVEATLTENPYIMEAQVYKDLKNNLMVNIVLRRPLARLVRKNRSQAYISYDGHILPISSKYTSRVPLISGEYADDFNRESMFENEKDHQIFNLLNSINDDEFFKIQVAQMEIDNELYIKIYPQVTKQIIEFGKPVDVQEKFRKLMIFYRQILPRKGWNSYSKVNVDFKGQIIAE